LLNRQCGLLGVSGRSADMRELLAAASNDARAALAVEMYCYRVRKYVGAFLAVLGGAQAVVFGGGTGENQPMIRQRICETLGWFGLALEPARNESAIGVEGRISRDGARIQAWVAIVDEAALIVEATAECLRSEGECN
jgi:acetate kinase